MSMPSPVLEL